MSEVLPAPTAEDRARDVVADYALCEAMTPGPWLAWSPEDVASSSWVGLASVAGLPVRSADRSVAFLRDDAVGLATAREAWPAALRRLAAAEAEVTQQRESIRGLRLALTKRFWQVGELAAKLRHCERVLLVEVLTERDALAAEVKKLKGQLRGGQA